MSDTLTNINQPHFSTIMYDKMVINPVKPTNPIKDNNENTNKDPAKSKTYNDIQSLADSLGHLLSKLAIDVHRGDNVGADETLVKAQETTIELQGKVAQLNWVYKIDL